MKKFKTESKKLLDLMINSIYTNREIFLRELISNASDAVDKLYFRSLTDTSIKVSKDDLAISVAFDKDTRTITVADSGIGMTKDELEKNLGTIAHSGSLEFKTENAESQGDDVDIIGQFGVGFYASFMVAQRVQVISRSYGSDETWMWESDGIEGYTVTETEELPSVFSTKAEQPTHGTVIILHLKDNTEEEDYDLFLNEYELKNLIKRYSNYVRYPIQMECEVRHELPKPEDAGDDYKPEYETVLEIQTINSMIPIWKRRKSEVSQEEYNEFYKTDFHDFTDPARTISVHAEGALEYDALLFIPGRAPYDLYSKDYKKGLALYSSNVLIMEKCEELLPDYFNFVRGVVDSQDLTLNISRETLQHNSQLRAIANKLEKKIKSELVKMRDNDREEYEKFFENFGRGLKYGIYSSYGMEKHQLGELLLFYSAKEKKMITLDEYIANMPEGQSSIFYAAGESVDRLAKMPIVKTIQDKGFDVLLCTQDVDEFCMTAMHDYGADEEGKNAKELKNVAGGDLGLETEDEKSAAEAITKENEELFKTMKDALGDAVSKVVVSARLSDTPACVTAEGPISLEMEKIMAMAPDGQNIKSDRVLEINAQHSIFKTLQEAQKENDTDKIKQYTNILYNQALITEGLPIEDPVAYAQAVCDLMK
ncbi:chaperone protein HtpG [Eggerthella sp. CAG:368]|nr:chaperone protein HtpG [Eggerthella sp. CAG:368]